MLLRMFAAMAVLIGVYPSDKEHASAAKAAVLKAVGFAGLKLTPVGPRGDLRQVDKPKQI